MWNSDGGMILRKINLYILSLSLLFFFFIVITIDIPTCFGDKCKFIGFEKLLASNVITIICILLFLYSIFAYFKFNYDIKQSTEIPFEVVKIEGINYEHLTFLATYVIPLITFDFEKTKYIIVLAMLLIVMGIIYIKTDLFYANPSLALMGFHIYKLDGVFKGDEKREGVIVITRKKIKMGDSVKYIKLDDRVYYSGY
ncbi:anti-phage protein KwaA [Lelliottia sp. V89_10]|uniref:anti-phage protein KwaA n=1 Tax=Lelliottia wanjuensis TaxID=3050585 RepID=UPI00249EB36B|nr:MULTISPECIES: anti-phage protein KwaA [unclassified Lelliottia]MDI3360077.1 anti-phage protein KwaA [Lelliottia sp. V89_13]MDK9548303.1 anti-phage protein KwaA [Lelliottia sp. V89_5]MDK9594857.1 anti-phage protein KwaA [Lelliottia sp. V89_10]